MKPVFSIALLCLLFAVTRTRAQTDVSQVIKDLPRKNGTYLLATVDGVNFYAVKKSGKIVGYELTDADGNPIPQADDTPSGARKTTIDPGGNLPKPVVHDCPHQPGQICGWSSFISQCVCITTVLK